MTKDFLLFFTPRMNKNSAYFRYQAYYLLNHIVEKLTIVGRSMGRNNQAAGNHKRRFSRLVSSNIQSKSFTGWIVDSLPGWVNWLWLLLCSP